MSSPEETTVEGLSSPAAHASPGLRREPGRSDPLRLYKSAEGYRVIMEWYEAILDEIPIPYESLFTNTRFGRTHLLAAGPRGAAALFLLPGVAGCAALWRRQLPTLGAHFRVYAVDIPGQPGRSDPNPPSFLNDDYCDWLTDVMDDLGLKRAHFAGVSVGAWIAMRMGMVRPERVGRVVMLGPTGIARARLPVRTYISRVARGLRRTDVLQDELTARKVSTTVARSRGESFGTYDRQLAKAMALCTKHYRVDRSLGIYDETSRRLRLWEGLKVLRKFFLAEPKAQLRRFAVPGLLVFGEHEVLYNPHAVGQKAVRLMGDVRVEVVPEAGHAAIYDRPEVVDPMIIGFLQGQPGPAA